MADEATDTIEPQQVECPSPIDILPDDLIIYIWLLADANSRDRPTSTTRTWSSVCRKWRGIALSVGSLWNTFLITWSGQPPNRSFQLQVERSRQALLDIRFASFSESAFETLRVDPGRWRHLYIARDAFVDANNYIRSLGEEGGEGILPGEFRNLESLNLDLSFMQTECAFPTFTKAGQTVFYPNLTSFTLLCAKGVSRFFPWFKESLRELSIRCIQTSLDEIQHILRSSPNITKLHLNIERTVRFKTDRPEFDEDVILSYLEDLSLAQAACTFEFYRAFSVSAHKLRRLKFRPSVIRDTGILSGKILTSTFPFKCSITELELHTARLDVPSCEFFFERCLSLQNIIVKSTIPSKVDVTPLMSCFLDGNAENQLVGLDLRSCYWDKLKVRSNEGQGIGSLVEKKLKANASAMGKEKPEIVLHLCSADTL